MSNIDNLTSSINDYKMAVDIFTNNCKKIYEIYDVLLRGTSCDFENVVPNWSDIDFTVIFKEINYESILKVREIYKNIQKKFNFKISLTLLTLHDYKHKLHHHGIKPIYYNKFLNQSLSLFGKKYEKKVFKDSSLTRYDCYLNVVYLIHDLRKRIMNLNSSEISSFIIHLLKRTKHLLRNSIYVITGVIGEGFETKLAKSLFPSLDLEFFDIISNYKYKSSYEKKSNSEKIKIINFIYSQAEYIYEVLLVKISVIDFLYEKEFV